MIEVGEAHRDTPTGRAAPRPTLHALTGLRFFAALLVVFSHFPELIPISSLHAGLDRQGAAGVTIFFVLSGFVLTYRYADTFATSTAATGRSCAPGWRGSRRCTSPPS